MAYEEEDEDVFGAPVAKIGPPTIVIAGPLAPKVRETLDEQYKKKVDEATGIVLEATVKPDGYENPNLKLVFCATEGKAGVGDLLSLTGKLSHMGKDVAMRASVILEPTKDKPGPVLESIKALCKRKHVPIYGSVNDYLRNNTP